MGKLIKIVRALSLRLTLHKNKVKYVKIKKSANEKTSTTKETLESKMTSTTIISAERLSPVSTLRQRGWGWGGCVVAATIYWIDICLIKRQKETPSLLYIYIYIYIYTEYYIVYNLPDKTEK